MKKKLYRAALITSPFIAIQGASPFYIFEAIDWETYLMLTAVLTLNTFIVWLIHIWHINKFPNTKLLTHFLATYAISLTLRVIIGTVNTLIGMEHPAFVDKYYSYPIIHSLTLNAIVMVIANAIVAVYKKAETEKQLHNAQLQHIEAQKQLLIQQLQPHFLFNALSVLKSLIAENQEVAQTYTLKLSDFLRHTLQSNQSELSPLKKELQFTQDYIDLQKMRYEEAFECTISVPKENLDLHLPVLALQTLVENIFKHNYFTEKNKLIFSIVSTDKEIIVTNRKTTLRENPKTQTGLLNLNKRYQLICGQPIYIEDTDVSFSVTLPLIKV